jgi:YbbR domain-containing protein
VDRLLERDFSLKVLSVFMAVILWFQVISQQNPERQVAVKNVVVQYINAGPNLFIMEKKPEFIEVQVRGYKRFVDGVVPADIKAVVDLSGAAPGRDLYPIEVGISKEKVTFAEARPSQATVKVEPLTKREVPVEVIASGLDPEYASGLPTAKPATASVQGASSVVARVVKMIAEVNLAGARATVQQPVSIKAVDIDGIEVKNNMVYTPSTVDISVPIMKMQPARTVPVKAPTPAGVPAPGYRVGSVSVEPATVSIRGLPTLIDDIVSVATQAVDVSGASANVVREVAVVMPQGVDIVDPRTVQVTVAVLPDTSAVKTLDVTPRLVNSVANLKYTLDATPVKVTVSGPEKLLVSLGADALDATVDVRGLGAGQYQLRVQIGPPAGVVVTRVEPERVGVTVAGP